MTRIANATTKSAGRKAPSRRWNHQASISGIAIFSSSLGWMTMPRFTQRCAPFLVMPNSATAISKATPKPYSGSAKLASRCGGICDTTSKMPSASSILRPWSEKRVPWSNPAEYMAVSPMAARVPMMKISGQS